MPKGFLAASAKGDAMLNRRMLLTGLLLVILPGARVFGQPAAKPGVPEA